MGPPRSSLSSRQLQKSLDNIVCAMKSEARDTVITIENTNNTKTSSNAQNAGSVAHSNISVTVNQTSARKVSQNHFLSITAGHNAVHVTVQQSNIKDDLQEAVSFIRNRLPEKVASVDTKLQVLMLGSALLKDYRRDQDLQVIPSLEKAMGSLENARILAGSQSMLKEMALHFSSKFTTSKLPRDLYTAIVFSLKTAVSDHSNTDSPYFDLFNSHLERFLDHNANLDEFRSIISNSTRRLLSRVPNAKVHDALHNLSIGFLRKYRAFPRITKLEAATRCATAAFAITRHDDSSHQRSLEVLSEIHHARHLRYDMDKSKELKIAIYYAEQAADLSERLGNSSGYFSLSTMLHSRYLLDGRQKIDDLDNSIHWIKKAIANLPKDSTQRPFSSFLHGRLLYLRYIHEHPVVRRTNLVCLLNPEGGEETKELDEAIKLIKEAENGLREISLSHPKLSMVYCGAGEALEVRYWAISSCHALSEASVYYAKAMHHPTSSPLELIAYARVAAKLHLQEIGDVDQGYRMLDYEWSKDCLRQAIELLPTISPQSIPIDDKQFALSQVSGLPAEAAAAMLNASQDSDLLGTLCLLELGRGVIIGSAIALRGLEVKHPKQFLALQKAFDSVAALRSDDLRPQNMTFKGKDLEKYQRLERTLANIRELSDFEDFLLPPESRHMERLVKARGAIAVYNSTESRSDAIIIVSNEIKHIPLPKFRFEEIEKNLSDMQDTVQDWNVFTRQNKNATFRSILEWLWISAVKPVCDFLSSINQESPGSVERIWWIGVGLLSKLPFHAAGIHGDYSKRNENVINNFRSSYIPTIKALSHAVKASSSSRMSEMAGINLSMVHMEKTPGYPDLQGLRGEVETIAGIAKKHGVNVQVLDTPSKQQVLKHFQTLKAASLGGRHHIVHFACHGICDLRNPLESHVVLSDINHDRASSNKQLEENNSEITTSSIVRGKPSNRIENKLGSSNQLPTNLLSVRDICDLDLSNAYLAYLGACHTANNSIKELADESLHLASAFQMAGCRNVIGNMWLAGNHESVRISQEFYKTLLGGTTPRPGVDPGANVSEAYHIAVQRVWEISHGADPIGWGSFVHYGA